MKFRDYAGYAALVCAWLSAGNLTGATFEESGLVELSPEEKASLSTPAPLWADEINDNEGPIVLRDDVVIPVAGNGPQAAGFAGTKWTGGIVYYQFNANVNGTNKSRFRAAATEWAANADLQFIESTGTGTYIEVLDSTENSSYVCMGSGVQYLRMYNWTYKYIIAHEIAHALGQHHEQSRSDRDTYVTILEDNIVSGQQHNFYKRNTIDFGDYDFTSVMHYSRNSFLKSGLPSGSNTIVPNAGYTQYLNIMGQRDNLSALDKSGMASYYGSASTKADLVDRGSTYRGLSATALQPGQSFTVSADVSNSGGANATSFKVDFYASSNTGITTSDFLLGTKTVNGLSKGNIVAIDQVVTLPQGISSGLYYIGWIIDSEGNIAEDDETNNTVYISSPRITVTAPPASVDLRDDGDFWHFMSPTTVAAGEAFTLNFDIRNAGISQSPAYKIRLYLSSDNTITTGDLFLHELSMSALNSGGYVDADFNNIQIPESIAPGEYVVGWIIDPGNAVQETDESNNTVRYKSGATKLTILPPAGFVFSIGTFAYFSNRTEITFNSISGKTYMIQTSTDMSNWSPVSGETAIPGNGSTRTVSILHSNQPPVNGKRYFRVRENP